MVQPGPNFGSTYPPCIAHGTQAKGQVHQHRCGVSPLPRDPQTTISSRLMVLSQEEGEVEGPGTGKNWVLS